MTEDTVLSDYAAEIRQLDDLLVQTLARRMNVTNQIGAHKLRTGAPVFRPEIERSRIEKTEELAREQGIDPAFAASIMHQIIAMSCKQQWALREGHDQHLVLPADPEERMKVLRRNLLELTEKIASGYELNGGEKYLGTKIYVEMEDRLVAEQIKEWQCSRGDEVGVPYGVALDLGTGAGHIMRRVAHNFARIIGYDVSQHMVDESWRRLEKEEGDFDHVEFVQHDLETGLPHDDASVDFVFMGLGTASDIPNIAELIKEIDRVLVPNGRFVLSFYNRDALMYADGFVPVDSGMAAEIDLHLNCLTVHATRIIKNEDGEERPVPADGARDYLIYARPYTWGEIESMLSGTNLRCNRQMTGPTLSSVMPRTQMNGPFARVIEQIDRSLNNVSTVHAGAYYLISGLK